MAINWHERFSRMARPASETEESKAERAGRMVREALRSSSALQLRDFDVVAFGSYRNNTNVRAGSDVDLAAVLRSAHWYDLPPGGALSREMLGLTDASYGLDAFRADVQRALHEQFGAADVAPGRIALTVDEGAARLVADVTPYLLHRRYTGNSATGHGWEYLEGIETRPTDAPSRRLIQWPEQHYKNGVEKNAGTNRRYKRVVRILKCLRDELRQSSLSAVRVVANATPSCFIEHAVFNVPDHLFNQNDGSYYDDVRSTLRSLWNAARDPSHAGSLKEVSMLHSLFRPTEPWSPQLLEDFTRLVWQHVGFFA